MLDESRLGCGLAPLALRQAHPLQDCVCAQPSRTLLEGAKGTRCSGEIPALQRTPDLPGGACPKPLL